MTRMPSSGAQAPRLMVRIAHTLHRRWEQLGASERERLAPLARAVKEGALELRGRADSATAERELAAANKALADGIADAMRSDPDYGTTEIEALRDELQRELDRVPRRRAA